MMAKPKAVHVRWRDSALMVIPRECVVSKKVVKL